MWTLWADAENTRSPAESRSVWTGDERPRSPAGRSCQRERAIRVEWARHRPHAIQDHSPDAKTRVSARRRANCTVPRSLVGAREPGEPGVRPLQRRVERAQRDQGVTARIAAGSVWGLTPRGSVVTCAHELQGPRVAGVAAGAEQVRSLRPPLLLRCTARERGCGRLHAGSDPKHSSVGIPNCDPLISSAPLQTFQRGSDPWLARFCVDDAALLDVRQRCRLMRRIRSSTWSYSRRS